MKVQGKLPAALSSDGDQPINRSLEMLFTALRLKE
jgi:hypothetical protein